MIAQRTNLGVTMRLSFAFGAMALAAATTFMSVGASYAQSCDQLWYERNSIYKAAGYCFKTARAIRAFGNAGCMYDVEAALPLSRFQRERIAAIVREERILGCRD
ncbi:MAG TPA: YARHG domain-containing protein [Stellaceae bacterium]|nr:YARHG domain-containing protein [Stellaceae bacterium]